jgi:ferrochelatase
MKGVLLVNLGSPDSPSVSGVRRYLNEFLMDGRVIDTPWPLRRLIVGMILINRPKESAHAYEKIWTPEGSPLVVISRHVREKLQERVSLPVELAMRYQNPSIESAIRSLAEQKVDETQLIPLFPHYSRRRCELPFNRRISTRRITLRRWWRARKIIWTPATTICCSVSTACRNGI